MASGKLLLHDISLLISWMPVYSVDSTPAVHLKRSLVYMRNGLIAALKAAGSVEITVWLEELLFGTM